MWDVLAYMKFSQEVDQEKERLRSCIRDFEMRDAPGFRIKTNQTNQSTTGLL